MSGVENNTMPTFLYNPTCCDHRLNIITFSPIGPPVINYAFIAPMIFLLLPFDFTKCQANTEKLGKASFSQQ